MSGHPLSVTVPNLTPAQAQELAEFVQAVLIDGRKPIYAKLDGWVAERVGDVIQARHADIERTAAELAGKGNAIPVPGTFDINIVPPPPPPPPAPVSAPAAAPSGGQSAVTAPGGAPSTGGSTARVDARGVPWDERYHAGKNAAESTPNPDGSWRRRKGSDKDAVKAYEAAYLGKGASAASTIAATIVNAGALSEHPTSPAPTATAPANGGASVPAVDPNNPLSYPPAPPPPPPPPGTPSYEQFAQLWTELCAAQVVTVELETWIKTTYGGHPTLSDVFKANPVARKAVWDVLLQYQPVAAA
jgi:hypothetical protein